ncbi:Pxr1, partial [Ophiophagus hannah]
KEKKKKEGREVGKKESSKKGKKKKKRKKEGRKEKEEKERKEGKEKKKEKEEGGKGRKEKKKKEGSEVGEERRKAEERRERENERNGGRKERRKEVKEGEEEKGRKGRKGRKEKRPPWFKSCKERGTSFGVGRAQSHFLEPFPSELPLTSPGRVWHLLKTLTQRTPRLFLTSFRVTRICPLPSRSKDLKAPKRRKPGGLSLESLRGRKRHEQDRSQKMQEALPSGRSQGKDRSSGRSSCNIGREQ